MNNLSIQFVKGGYILNVENDESGTVEVFQSTAKLVKAVRTAIEELTLVPKNKAEAADAE